MKGAIFLLLTITAVNAFTQGLSKRVVHNNPTTYRQLSAVHAGVGQMKFTGLLGSGALSTNFLYLHAGEIPDKGGIGQHFHHTIKEMFVILDGEAEFTVNGRTSKIKGPAVKFARMFLTENVLDRKGRSPSADGMAIDKEGNLYVAKYYGVQIFSNKREYVGMINLPSFPVSLCFGEGDMKTLFIVS